MSPPDGDRGARPDPEPETGTGAATGAERPPARRAPRAAALPALLVLVLGAWVARAPAGPAAVDPQGPERSAAPGLPAAELCARARAVQLALATGSAPDRDPYLAHSAGTARQPGAVVPFSPSSTALLAALARRLAGGEAEAVDEAALERLLGWLPRLGGALAALAAYLAARRAAGCAPPAALAVAALAALVPPLALAERAGGAGLEPFAAALLFAMVALLGGLRRARDLSDATLAGMLAGGAGGLAVLLSSTALPLLVATGAVLLARAGTTPEPLEPAPGTRSPRADAWRAALLFVMAAFAVVELPPVGDSTLRARLGMGAVTGGWWARALMPVLPLALARVLGDRRRGEQGTSRRVLLAATAVLAALLVPLGAGLREAGLRDGSGARAGSDRELARALEWLRRSTPSPGPYNHPGAAQDWCLLTAPALGAAVAYRGRRPVVATSLPAAWTPSEKNAHAALDVLAHGDSAEAALTLRALGVSYVLVTPRMARGTPDDSLLRRLALGGAEVPGLERVYASEVAVDDEGRAGPAARGPTGPAVSIHRARLAPRGVPSASPAR